MTQPADPSGAEERASGVALRIGAALAFIAVHCFRRPLQALLAVVLVLAAAGYGVSKLKIDPDIAELLPPSYESVQDLETLKQRFGGVGYVVLLLDGGTPEARRAVAKGLAPELAALPSVSYVEVERPAAYLRSKALWLFEVDDLRELERRVRIRYHYDIERSFLDLDDRAPPSVKVDDLVAKLEARFGGLQGGDDAPSTYYEDASRLAVFVRPTELASNLDFSRRVVAEVEQVAAKSAALTAHPEVRFELTGRYKKRVDLQEVLASDLRLTSIVSILLVAGYLALHFRRWTAIVLLIIPLNAGLLLAYGLAAATFGSLNILTTFLGAILVGIGVDSGIHILGRVHEVAAGGASQEEAVRVAFRDAGRVSLAAMLTTAAAFMCLTVTDFRAFREFGVLTAAGVLLVFLCYLFMLPALISLADRTRLTRHRAAAASLPGTGWLGRRARLVVPVMGLAALIFAGLSARVHFDSDFSRLDDADLPSFRLDRQVTELLGRSQTPLVAFPENDSQATQAAEVARERMRQAGTLATIGEVVTLSELVPPDVEARAPYVTSVQKMLSRIARGDQREELLRSFPDLDALIEATAPTKESLPESLRQVLTPQDGEAATPLMLLYPSVSLSDAEAVRRTADQVRHLSLESGEVVRTAGEPIILADILKLIAQDGPRILLLTLVFIFVFLRLTLGSFRMATLATVPAVLTLLVTAGAVAAFGLSLNMLNIIILPILLGIGVDDGAHLLARIEAGEPLPVVWRHTGADVGGAILTDAFGFGALALAAHPGLASLGQVALIGLAANFLICVVLLPAVLSLVPLVRVRAAASATLNDTEVSADGVLTHRRTP
ncbi:MAG: MMPL family transporter [Polyangiaceae bacterium]|nr:MMPL family transporter [Polyangiaceae bacterium]MCW5792668.1 MMPL family transporter [Polyangiaceae bacterium]